MQHPLDAIRKYYLECFRQSINEAQGHYDQFTTELLLELPTLKHHEYCYRLYRADIIGKRLGKAGVREVNVTPRTAEPNELGFGNIISFDWPLVWNGIEFRIADAQPNEHRIIEWASKWLDISDNRYDEAAQFQGVVHSVAPPERTDMGYEFSVDFGSAPVTAFDELLSLIIRDASRVSVGSFSY